ncbi:MAG TPA: hypothetical protein ENO21_03565 [Firmicutes bacterium]|nr:hypothetical protein [Bacillota bacterium]
MRMFIIVLAAAALLAIPVAASANGSAVDQFSAVKYIRNLSDLACQYRDHGLSLQLDGYNYEWLIFQDSCIRDNIEAELIILGRSREHIIDPLAWQLHVDMLGATIEQINTISDELLTYNFYPNQDRIVQKIQRKANEGSGVLGDIEDELGRGEERNYADLATYGETLWLIGNDLICLVKDLDFENWTALYSGDLCAGDCGQNSFEVQTACWECGSESCNGCPEVGCATVQGKECETKRCAPTNKCKGKGCKQNTCGHCR